MSSQKPKKICPHRGLLSDLQIEEMCQGDQPMISPYNRDLIRKGVGDVGIISFGQSSYGYDLRAGRDCAIFIADQGGHPIDPKRFDESKVYRTHPEAPSVVIPPNGFLLTHSEEVIDMPANVSGVVLGKSTYARCGLVCIATPLEAGWSGQVVLEFANTTPSPMLFYPGEGCAQVLFFAGDHCRTDYGDRLGKYQGQRGLTWSKV